MKFLKLFKTLSEKTSFALTEQNTPNVNYCQEDKKISLNEKIIPEPVYYMNSTYFNLASWENFGANEVKTGKHTIPIKDLQRKSVYLIGILDYDYPFELQMDTMYNDKISAEINDSVDNGTSIEFNADGTFRFTYHPFNDKQHYASFDITAIKIDGVTYKIENKNL